MTSLKSAGVLEDWISKLAKGGRAKKRCQFCVNPNSLNQFLYLRAIQGHSGESAINPALQDNILIPKGFTEYLYHVGYANELNSKLRNGLIPGGTSLKRGRHAVFFTTVNPMEDVYGMGETPCDLTKPRIAPYKNTWKRFQNTVSWCNLKLAQEKDLQFYQTRSHAVVLYNTLPAACIEKAVCMKNTDELYQKVSLTPRATSCVKNRTRNMVCKIHKTKTQDHLGNHEVTRKVLVKPVTTPWIMEYLEYLFLQSSCRIQYARTKSRG